MNSSETIANFFLAGGGDSSTAAAAGAIDGALGDVCLEPFLGANRCFRTILLIKGNWLLLYRGGIGGSLESDAE